MKIANIKKLKSGKYKLDFDNGDSISLYEDILIQYGLITKKEIDETRLDSIYKDNFNYGIYDEALKYIEVRLRSKEEIYKYLLKKGYEEELINSTIERLEKNHFIDDTSFAKAFIQDKLYLTSMGPEKIKQELIHLRVEESIIDRLLEQVDKIVIQEKLEKIIDKKLNIKSKYTGNVWKQKIVDYMLNLGFRKEDIISYLDTKQFTNYNNLKRDYEKILKKYSKRQEGYQLKGTIYRKLYALGYDSDAINSIIEI